MVVALYVMHKTVISIYNLFQRYGKGQYYHIGSVTFIDLFIWFIWVIGISVTSHIGLCNNIANYGLDQHFVTKKKYNSVCCYKYSSIACCLYFIHTLLNRYIYTFCPLLSSCQEAADGSSHIHCSDTPWITCYK